MPCVTARVWQRSWMRRVVSTPNPCATSMFCATPVSSNQNPAELRGLVGVTLKPRRVGLPFMQLGVTIANRHLDLRQTLFVEYQVLRDHLIHEEQVGRQRIDLIGGESPLIPERHAAIDEI